MRAFRTRAEPVPSTGRKRCSKTRSGSSAGSGGSDQRREPGPRRLVARDRLDELGHADLASRSPERPAEVDVVEERRRLGRVADVLRHVPDPQPTGADLHLALEDKRPVLDAASNESVALLDHLRRLVVVMAVQRKALGRRADVLEPARRHEPAAPFVAVEARAGEPRELDSVEPRLRHVEPALRQQPNGEVPRLEPHTISGRSTFRASRKPRLTSSSSPSKRRSSCSIETTPS